MPAKTVPPHLRDSAPLSPADVPSIAQPHSPSPAASPFQPQNSEAEPPTVPQTARLIVRWGHIPGEARRFRCQKTTSLPCESWEQFHDPRSLVLALVGEVGELAELFQWSTISVDEAKNPDSNMHHRVSEEVSDVLLYLLRIADVLDIDLIPAAHEKLSRAADKYPANEYSSQAPDKVNKA